MDKPSTFRDQAALQILCALLETTKHNVLLEPELKKIYVKTAIGYAEELIAELNSNQDNLKVNKYENR